MRTNDMAAVPVEYPQPKTVLLAEDELLIRLDIAETLRDLGWTVVEVSNAEDGIAVLRSRIPVDLVLTDIQMPGGKNGLDLAKAARRERPGLRIVIMSGNLKIGEDVMALCDKFISKPFINIIDTLPELKNVATPGKP